MLLEELLLAFSKMQAPFHLQNYWVLRGRFKMVLPSQASLEVSFWRVAGCLDFLEDQLATFWPVSLTSKKCPQRVRFVAWEPEGLLLLIFSFNLPNVLGHASIDSNKTNGSVNAEAYEALLSICGFLVAIWWLVICESQQKAGPQMTNRKSQAVSLNAFYHCY